jgi:nodulation protein E
MSDIAITGLGCVSALGQGLDPFWSAVKGGQSGVGPTKLSRWLGHKIRISAQVDRDHIASQFGESEQAQYDPCTQFALLAAKEAIAQAGLAPEEIAGPRTAVIVGCSNGGVTTMDEVCHALYAEHETRVSPLTIPRFMANAPASHISMKTGATGPAFAVSSACASASQAIGVGAALVRSGVVDRAIVGGTDATITPGTTRAWEMMRVLTPDACRPFSRGRNGMVLGEGAGIVVLESAEAALARRAPILAWLLGYGTSSDAKDLLRPDPEGAAAAMKLALADAGLVPADVDYINAHGTGTVLNDSSETQAVKLAFGERAGTIPVSSTKPIHGHALGASGALELIATIMALREQCVPPTINWMERDPQCDLDIVIGDARRATLQIAMSNSFAFGGINASLIVGHA